jgi:pimeloyl-ACP methyl ester carboxylesterase
MRIVTLAILIGYMPLSSAASWAAQNATNDARSVKAPDGVEIRYETVGSGSPTLVFVHGWSCDRTYWAHQIEHFSKHFRIVAIDLAGHGQSGSGRKDWTMAAFGADVAAVLRALEAKSVVLVGHSMGGPVVLEAARQEPKRIAALVIVDGVVDVSQRLGKVQRDEFLAPFRADFKRGLAAWAKKDLFTPRSDPKLVERIVQDMSQAPPGIAISAMENLMAFDEAAALARIKQPIRLINADASPTNLAAARKQNAQIELAVVPRIGHFLMLEDPEEFNRLLSRAVRDLADR